jgi:hypothetical protein
MMTERAQALEAIDQMLSYMVVNAADRRVLSAEIRLAVYGPPPAGPTRQPDTGPPPPPPPVGSPTTGLEPPSIWIDAQGNDHRYVEKESPAYTPVEPASEPPSDTRRDCTCLGTCKGADGLSPRYRCALSPAPVSPVEPTPEPPTEDWYVGGRIDKCPDPRCGCSMEHSPDCAIPVPRDLVRYGVTWPCVAGEPLLTPMPDGYWTPWHLAVETPTGAPTPCVWRETRDHGLTVYTPICRPECVTDTPLVTEYVVCPHCKAPLTVER